MPAVTKTAIPVGATWRSAPPVSWVPYIRNLLPKGVELVVAPLDWEAWPSAAYDVLVIDNRRPVPLALRG